MASIEERLNRREFEHKPGAELYGEIIKVTDAEWKFGFYPILVVRDDDGTEHILSCYLSLSWLAGPVIAHRPARGERVGVRCDEPEADKDGKEWNRGAVEFDRDDDTEPDWDRMIESRRRDRYDKSDDKQLAGNGGDTDTGSGDPWAKKSTAETTKEWEGATSTEAPAF